MSIEIERTLDQKRIVIGLASWPGTLAITALYFAR